MNISIASYRTVVLAILLVWLVLGVVAYFINPYVASEYGIVRKKTALHYAHMVVQCDFSCPKPTLAEVIKKNSILVLNGPMAFYK